MQQALAVWPPKHKLHVTNTSGLVLVSRYQLVNVQVEMQERIRRIPIALSRQPCHELGTAKFARNRVVILRRQQS